MNTIAVIIGTVPEAVKLAPVCRALPKYGSNVRTHIVLSGQHQQRVRSILQLFNVRPHHELSAKITRRGLAPMIASIVQAIDDILERLSADIVIVQGDTA